MTERSVPTSRLRAAIVGGGIGGLAAACSLSSRGIDVTVFEQATALGEVGAGVFIYPNSLRQLERLGLGDALAAVGAKVGSGSQYYRMDGSVVGQILTTDSSGWNGMYGMHRADLLNALAATLPPSSIRTGYRCVGLEQDADAAQLQFANGETAEADIAGIFRGSCLPRPASARQSSGLARRSPPGLDGRSKALHGVSGSQRPPAQLRRLRAYPGPDR